MMDFRIPFGTMGLTLVSGLTALTAEAGPGARYRLQAETWISQAGGGQSATYTAHAYDGEGRRLRTEISLGLDGSGEVFEKREFSYRPDGLLEAQSTYHGSDLEARIVHRYDAAGRLSERVVAGGDGRERFRDAYAYDDRGRMVAETRLQGGSTAAMRRFAYGSDGQLAGDSLFEPEGGVLLPVQAGLHGEGRVPEERREARWRRQNGAWYHVLDTFRLHQAGLLVSSAAYQVGGLRLDSSAFAYDADGNRLLEERFDGAGSPLSRLVLQWMDMQPVTLRRHAAGGRGAPRGPLPRLGGPPGAGWTGDGLDLLGRPRHRAFTANGRQE